MVWLYILIFIPLITAVRRRDESSYRSNIMPGNKPILLLYAKANDYSEFDSGKDRHTSSPPKMKVPGEGRQRLVRWVSSLLPFEVQNKPGSYYPKPDYDPSELRYNGFRPGNKQILLLLAKKDYSEFDSGKDRQTGPPSQMKAPEWTHRRIFSWVKRLLNHPPKYPYSPPQMLRSKVPNGLNEVEKPVLRMPSKDNDDIISSFNEVEKPVLRMPSKDNDDIVSSFIEDNKPILRLQFNSESSMRSKAKRTKKKHNKKKVVQQLREQMKPDWVTDLKDYIKDLTSHYGLEEVVQRAKPVIRSMEKKQHVKVKDVDVDEYGEVHITYTERKKSNKKSGRHSNVADET